MESRKRRKIVLIAGVSAFLGLLVLLWLALSGIRNVVAEVAVVPSDAALTVDGQPAKPGKLSLSPGKHTLRGTRELFGAATVEINTADLRANEVIYVVLDATSKEAQAYLANHPEEQMLYEKASGAEFSATQEKLLEDYPFITQLPYRTLDFKIDYSVGPDKKITLNIELYPVATSPGSAEYKQQLQQFKERALAYLRSQEVDLNKISITFSPDPSKL